jgi:hypothetical protein
MNNSVPILDSRSCFQNFQVFKLFGMPKFGHLLVKLLGNKIKMYFY